MKFAPRKRNARLTLELLENRCLLTAGLLDIELVSTGNPGDPAAQVGNDHSTRQAISANGRYVAFVSEATNLTPGDLNGVKDVFVKDLHTGVLTLASTAADGTQGNFASSFFSPSLSADGRYVAFDSRSTNLVPHDRNGSTSDIFIKDLKSGRVTLASVAKNGTQIPGGSYTPALTPDGRYVAFGGDDGAYRKDLRTGDLTLVAYGFFNEVSISDDGQFVAYGGFGGVSVKDMQTEVVTLANSSLEGAPGNSSSFFSQISGNGRYVAFGSYADNLVPSDGNGHFADIFVKDLTTGDVRLVSNAQDGAAGDDAAFFSAISQDGTWIVFSSDAGNLVPGDANGNGTDFFVRNLLTDELTLLTHAAAAVGSYFEPGISANGRYVAFDGRNGDYVPGDVNGVNDIFFVDLHNGPAGDVHTEVIHDPVQGNILVLTGDVGDNDISVSPLSEAGSYLVEGRFGTTLNGSAAAVAYTGIQSIRFELGSGDDSVLAENLTIGSLEVLLGDGDDTLDVRGKDLGALTIDAGSGMDTVTLEAVIILGKTDIHMGEGDDVLSLVDAYFADDVFLDGGLDEDILALLGSNTFQRKVRRIRF